VLQRPALRSRRSHHAPPGYEASQRTRKAIEEPFGWGKTIGGLARPMLRGTKKLDFKFALTMAGDIDPPAKAPRGMNSANPTALDRVIKREPSHT
jgi:hypothetical protein